MLKKLDSLRFSAMFTTKIAILIALTTSFVGIVFANENECEDLNPPINLRIEEEDSYLKVIWSVNDNCRTSYRVEEHYLHEVETHITVDSFYYINKPPYCTELTVIVSRLAEDDRESDSAVETYTRSKDSIRVLNFKLSEENGILKAGWDSLDNLEYCNVTNIIYELNSGLQYWATPNLEILLPNYTGFKPCNIAHFSIVPIIDGVRTSRVTESYEIGKSFIQVRNFKLSEEEGTLKAVWDAPDNLEYCNIKSIVYELNAGQQYWATLNLNILLPNYTGFKPCNIANFSIVPIIDGVRTSRVTESYEIGKSFIQVRNFKLSEEEGTLKAVWDAPDNLEYCNIKSIVYELNAGQQYWATPNLNILLPNYTGFKPCTIASFFVTPIIDGVRTSMVTDSYEIGKRSIQVRNFKLSAEKGTLKAVWDAPDNLEYCNAQTIVYELNSGLQYWATPNLDILLPNYTGFKPCTIASFSVTPIIDGVRTSMVTDSYEIGKSSIQVRNFKLSEENGILKAAWDALDNLEYCNIKTIVYELNSGLQYWATPNLDILLPNYTGFKPCNIVNFVIVPIIDGVRTSSVTDSYELGLPDNFGDVFQYTATVQSVDDDHFVTMTWELDDIGYCAIEYVVSCSDADNSALEEQINTPSFEFRACPIIEESGQYITVTIQPRLIGDSPGEDRNGQVTVCEFYAYYESASWDLTGDCRPLYGEQRRVNNH